MRTSRDFLLERDLINKLATFQQIIPLPGIAGLPERERKKKQKDKRKRRVQYVTMIRNKSNSPTCVDPTIGGFNPIKAASYLNANGNQEEACWLIFLTTHFSRNKFSGWQLVQDVYGMRGNGVFDWHQACQSPQALGQWIDQNEHILKARGGNFGNHRKYQSLSANHTGRTISSYINWIGPANLHSIKFAQLEPNEHNPKVRFRAFYNSMVQVYGFGRTGVFDYLTMMGKLQLIDVEPDSVYMTGATGPYTGGQLLFTGSSASTISRGQLDQMLTALDDHLGISFGMQVLEDALCNWQKQPAQYAYFNG